jgi:Pectate lyase superfamily protein
MSGTIDVRDVSLPSPARGDGVQDDSKAFDDALAEMQRQGGGLVVVSPGRYRVSRTISVPPRCALEGTLQAEDVCAIVGDPSLRGPVVEISGGANVSVRNLTIRRGTDDPDPVDVGVLVRGGYALLENLLITNQGIGCAVGNSYPDIILGTKLNRVHVFNVKTAYCQVRDAVETTFTDCEFGRNGGEPVGPAGAYVRIEGKADTINFLRCQFNSRNPRQDVFRGLYFRDVRDGGVLNLVACHMELVAFPFWFENTPTFGPMSISSCTVHSGPKRLCFVKDNADPTLDPTKLQQTSIYGSRIDFIVRAQDNIRVDSSAWIDPELVDPDEQKVRDVYLNLVRGYTPQEDWVGLYVPHYKEHGEKVLYDAIVSDHAEKIVRYGFSFFTGREVPNDWLQLYIPHLKAHGPGILHDAIVGDHGETTIRTLYHYLLGQDIDAGWLAAYKGYLRQYGYITLSQQILADPHPRFRGIGPAGVLPVGRASPLTGVLPIWRASTPRI